MVLGLLLCPDGTLLAIPTMVSIKNMIHVDIRSGMSKRHKIISGQNVTQGTRLEPIIKEHKECMSHWVIFLLCPILTPCHPLPRHTQIHQEFPLTI